MNQSRALITDADLQAWVDARASTDDIERVEQALAADPELRTRALHYRRQNEALREMLAGELEESAPPALLAVANEGPSRAGERARSGLRPANEHIFIRAAALFLAIGIGVVIGWTSRGAAPEQAALAPTAPHGLPLVRAAAVAHAAFVPEVRHPVEVAASEQTHLVAWLSKRLGAQLKVPNLEPEGFRLVGGRLLPDASDGVAAQFMFESVSGQRLTLFLRRNASDSDTAFRYVEQGRLGTFYWVDRGFGYALSGELEREKMLGVASSVYRQLSS
jgi:anti-sigma factor RsiW